jgi:stage III sporulation protein AH
MNSKRQTIWLVSMLSLMVVLSAYYLFTEDSSKLNATTDTTQTQEVKVDNTETTPNAIAKTDTQNQTNTENQANTEDQANTKTNTSSETTTNQLTDAQVLDKIAQQGKSNEDYFISQQLQRNDNFAKQTHNLMTIITDSKQNTEALTKAYNDLDLIQKRQAKLSNIEDQLLKDYPNVIVTEEANKWKVVLQENKLEKSQAVSIVDLVTQELSVGPENVSIKVIPK